VPWFVEHYTIGKEKVKQGVTLSLAESLFGRLHGEMVKTAGDIVVDRPANDFTVESD
jgi:hypothetical protein